MPKPSQEKAKSLKASTKVVGSKPAKRPSPKLAAAMKFGPRKDLGAPVDGFFDRQPPHLRPVLDQLRVLIGEAAPKATSTIKWGMPFYAIAGNTVCAIGAFKQHVNLILPGPPGTYADPDGRLEGDGKTGKHLKLLSLDGFPRAAIRGWLKIAAARAQT